MFKIEGLTSNPKQKFIIPLETRDKVDFRFYFMPTQQAWFFDFKYKDNEFNGHKLVLGMNILRMYKNIIPFGLAVKAENHIEPFQLSDFTSDRVKLYILNKNDVLSIETDIFGINNDKVE